ncbi:MAG: 60S ribosomal L32 [Lasallia pustulata]|uniref:60S ribosomal L32 n=1 Tax=Lasallia pustulata TaxID=136370 RepID=A0A5M8PGN4_9LECA|nr:MAG: 60S ribosomal L32 [Lasallia pustulata]
MKSMSGSRETGQAMLETLPLFAYTSAQATTPHGHRENLKLKTPTIIDNNRQDGRRKEAHQDREKAHQAFQPPPERHLHGQIAMPSIGYGSNRKTRHLMPSGHKAFLVQNVADVDLLLMHNKTFAAEIGHAVSSRKRIEIISRAKQLGVKVTNPKARVTTEA